LFLAQSTSGAASNLVHCKTEAAIARPLRIPSVEAEITPATIKKPRLMLPVGDKKNAGVSPAGVEGFA
jgi:hypothetical protein